MAVIALSWRGALAVGIGIAVGIATLLCWREGLQESVLRQPGVEREAQTTGSPPAPPPPAPPPPAPPPPAPPPPAPPPPAPPQTCNANCEKNGRNGTCSQQIEWLVDAKFSDMPSACWESWARVRSTCPSCRECGYYSTGCTTPCKRSCTLGGHTASCRAQVQHLASRAPPETEDACAAASTKVSTECPSCSLCNLAATGCVLACDMQCPLRGVNVSCRSRIQWLADHEFSERQDACAAAHQTVLGECPACSSCALAASGCKISQGTSVQMRLLQRIYGISVPSPLKKLPSCAKTLQVFIYDIFSAYHADLIALIQRRRRFSNCDYEVTQCLERNWDSDYSVMRSCAGEVPLLLKFLSMPQITEDAQKADLFVVPWFGALSKIVMEQPWGGGDKTVQAHTMEILEQLPHMRDPDKARRHVFLSSIDHDDVSTTLLSRARAGALLLHYGPSAGPREIVVVPSGAGFGAPLGRLQHPAPNFLFYMAGAVNPARFLMNWEVSRIRTIRPDLQIIHRRIEGHRKLAMTPAETQRAMSRSLLCPIAQGDLPFQHRFFDALASGCIPVVIQYTEPSKCDTWSYNYTKGPMGKWPRPCVHNTYPMASSIRYHHVVVQVPAVMFKNGSFAEFLVNLNRTELDQKRHRLEGMRHLFVYDRTGKTYDAFSGALQEICKAIGAG